MPKYEFDELLVGGLRVLTEDCETNPVVVEIHDGAIGILIRFMKRSELTDHLDRCFDSDHLSESLRKEGVPYGVPECIALCIPTTLQAITGEVLVCKIKRLISQTDSESPLIDIFQGFLPEFLGHLTNVR